MEEEVVDVGRLNRLPDDVNKLFASHIWFEFVLSHIWLVPGYIGSNYI